MKLPCYDIRGRKQAAYKVADQVFGVKKINHNLLRLAYEYYRARQRRRLARTKTRGLIRGGGRKPWPQKGTGRARVSSIRSPLWRGGGTVFGPTGKESYLKKLNRKTKSLALRHALSAKRDQALVLQDLPDDGKTSTVASLLFKDLKLNKRVLLIDREPSETVLQAVANLQNVTLVSTGYLNALRVLDADWLVLTPEGVEQLQSRLSLLAELTA